MLNGRKKVSEKIDFIVKERYADLIGKFFVLKDGVKSLSPNKLYQVNDVYSVSDYVGSNTVKIVIKLSTLEKSYDYYLDESDYRIFSIFHSSECVEFTVEEDLYDLVKGCIITSEEAMKNYIMKDFFGLINETFSIKEEN